jgi:hypothetical protein
MDHILFVFPIVGETSGREWFLQLGSGASRSSRKARASASAQATKAIMPDTTLEDKRARLENMCVTFQQKFKVRRCPSGRQARATCREAMTAAHPQ